MFEKAIEEWILVYRKYMPKEWKEKVFKALYFYLRAKYSRNKPVEEEYNKIEQRVMDKINKNRVKNKLLEKEGGKEVERLKNSQLKNKNTMIILKGINQKGKLQKPYIKGSPEDISQQKFLKQGEKLTKALLENLKKNLKSGVKLT